MPAQERQPTAAASGEVSVGLTDADTMRALAHPARIAVLWHLGIEGPATATECAPIAGVSPSVCSYHLRILERYGLVERDPDTPASGRERPWRARQLGTRVETQDNPAAQMAADLLIQTMDQHWMQARSRFQANKSAYDKKWRPVYGTDLQILHVTAKEAADLRALIQGLLQFFVRVPKAERPEGSEKVQVVVDWALMFEPEQTDQ
jgi:DNA-binding MarR family transcriptional regulator